jgi:hypothetical protein
MAKSVVRHFNMVVARNQAVAAEYSADFFVRRVFKAPPQAMS